MESNTSDNPTSPSRHKISSFGTALGFTMLLSALATPVLAAPVPYAVDFTWSDGGTLVGTLTLDDVTRDIIEWDLTSTNFFGGTLPALITYKTTDPTSGLKQFNIFSHSVPGFNPEGPTIHILFNPDLDTQLLSGSLITDASESVRTGCVTFPLISCAEMGNHTYSGPPVTQSAVPAPAAGLLLSTGLLGLAGYQWLQRRRERLQVG